jgi:hypothetical protein
MAKEVSVHPCHLGLLHSFDIYIKEMSSTELFNKYALIPNREQLLQKSSELKNADSIPGWLSDIVKPLISDCVATFVHSDFADVAELTSFSRKDLSEKINVQLSELRTKHLNKNECYDNNTLSILAKICMIYNQRGLSTYRNKVMPIVSKHLKLEYNELELPATDSEERDIAQLPFKHLVENMLLEIAGKDATWMETNATYVFELHSALSSWIEYYNPTNHKGLAKIYGAYPNRQNKPCAVSELKYCQDDLSELTPLYKSVLEKDIDTVLVQEEYQNFCDFAKATADEFAAEIESKLEEEKFASDCVLDIINHLDGNNDTAKWRKWFPRIEEKKAELFLKHVRSECQDSIFRLMKVDDPSKLNQLADLADCVDLDEIIQRGKRSIVEKRNQEAEFEYKERLGKYVEEHLRTALEKHLQVTLNDGFNHAISVQNEQGGHDLVVYYHSEPIYYLEIKSRWGSDQSVMMSPLQMATSVNEASQYALCCVDMTGAHIREDEIRSYPAIENTIARIKSLTNIGELNSKVIESTEYNRNNNNAIHISGDFKCIVPQKVINDYGIDFTSLVSTIVDKIMPLLSSKEAV